MIDDNDLFVYGTLRFGDVRWRFLEPFVVDHGTTDSVRGMLFDTGAGYPAAIFDSIETGTTESGLATIIGHRYQLISETSAEALRILDEVESAVTGLYQRIRITTDAGSAAWTYQYGLSIDDPALQLVPIASGDWFEYRRNRASR